MTQESIVYGCIKGGAGHSDEDVKTFNRLNQSVLYRLPVLDEWPFLTREMFSITRQQTALQTPSINLIHFGCSYSGIEYEWNIWMQKFESLLKAMAWQSAVVHLDTELSGLHTFIWETDGDIHSPNTDGFNVRCEWNHEMAS